MNEEMDLFYHALNYRGASIKDADLFWKELESCVNRLIAAEREACAKLCEDNCAGYSYGRETQGPCLTEFPKEGGGRHDGMTYADAIRMRSKE